MKTFLSPGFYSSEKDLSRRSGAFISGSRKISSSGKSTSPVSPVSPVLPVPPITDCSINVFVNNDYICDYFV